MSNIRKNFIYNAIYQILIIILPIITTPYISRVIGAEGLGVYSYSYSIASCFALICVLGVTDYGSRSIAQVRDDKHKLNKTFWSIYSLQLITSVIGIGAYLIYIVKFIKFNKLIFIIEVIYVISFSIDINWLLSGLEEFKIIVTRNIIIKIITLLSILFFVKDTNDLYLYTLIMCLSSLFTQIISLSYLKRYIGFCKISLKDIKIHAIPNLKLFIPVMSFAIFKLVDKVMLGSLSNMTQVGYYENVVKVIDLPMGLITALGVVMLPKISNIIANGNKDQSIVYINNSMKFAMFMAFGICFGIASISNTFTPIFFGIEFMACTDLLKVMSMIVILKAWENVIKTQYLIPNSYDDIYIKSNIFGAIVNVISNIYFISRFDALGAIIGSLLGQATICIYQNIKISNCLNLNKYIKDSIIYLVSGIIMFIVVSRIGKLLPISIISLFVQILTGIIVYILIIYILFNINKNTNKNLAEIEV